MRTIIKKEILYSDYAAIKDENGKKITFYELAKKAEGLGEVIEERSLLFFLCDYQMETVEFLYEVIYRNYVPLLLPKDMDEELLENLIKIYHPQYIYCRNFHGFSKRFPCVFTWDKHVLLRTEKDRYAIHPDIAILLSTSGTTGSAKLVRLSYENLRDASKHASAYMEISQGQKGICPSPINHILGFIFCMWHWYRGATVLVTEEMVISQRFQKFCLRERVNNFAATPYMYKMLLKIKFWDKGILENLHWALAAGEKMPEEEQTVMQSFMGGKFRLGYGQTECGGYISGIRPGAEQAKKKSVGKILEHIEAEVNRDSGELIIKSESVCMGYADCAEQLAEGDVNGGILHTGDIAQLDAEGYIYLQGRLKRYVKVLGKRVNLDDIEYYLKRKYPGMECACIGNDNEICVFYTEKETEMEKIRDPLVKNMNIPYKFVSCIAVDYLPRNSSGKVAYSSLEEMKYAGKNTGNM